jgi:hypothetical protein
MNTPRPDNIAPLDQALADRLARLRTMPVDTSHLDKAIEAQIPRPRLRGRRIWLRPLRAAAAILMLAAVIGALL